MLTEASSDGRTVLWLPGERAGQFRHWDRVTTTALVTATIGHGVRSVTATSVPFRQRRTRPLGRLLSALRPADVDRLLTLPDGTTAEPCGSRRTDLILAWSDDPTAPLDAAGAQGRWPDAGTPRPVGPNLVLVPGVRPPVLPTDTAPSPGPSSPNPRALAELALQAARAAGDPRRESTALADLGLACLHDGDTCPAGNLLDEALAAARRAGDDALAADALCNLGLAANAVRQYARARASLDPALAHARAAADRHLEKLALDRLATALQGLGDHAAAFARLDEARSLAAALGDRRHEAELLWRLSVQHAELGRPARAAHDARAAVALFRSLGDPAADWYARHLSNFLAAAPAPPSSGLYLGGSINAAVLSSPPASTRPPASPGLLRMAVTAARSMAAFVASGLRTAPPETYRARLSACSTCPHHTGLRCRVCGCLTSAKARLLHERCPTGRWPG